MDKKWGSEVVEGLEVCFFVSLDVLFYWNDVWKKHVIFPDKCYRFWWTFGCDHSS